MAFSRSEHLASRLPPYFLHYFVQETHWRTLSLRKTVFSSRQSPSACPDRPCRQAGTERAHNARLHLPPRHHGSRNQVWPASHLGLAALHQLRWFQSCLWFRLPGCCRSCPSSCQGGGRPSVSLAKPSASRHHHQLRGPRPLHRHSLPSTCLARPDFRRHGPSSVSSQQSFQPFFS